MGVAGNGYLGIGGWWGHPDYVSDFLKYATVTPLLLKKIHIDPAVAAGPFITTAMDITGVSIYLGFATAMLEYLR